MRLSVGLAIGVLCALVLAGCDSPLNPVGPTQVGLKAERQPGALVPTRIKPVPLTKAVVSGTLELFTEAGTEPGQVFYVFAPKLTESAGVSATVTSVFVWFDEGWGGACGWKTGQMVHTRLLAGDTLTLDTLSCPGWDATWVDVWIDLKDDNGFETFVYFGRPL
jgi:hypothetical protein